MAAPDRSAEFVGLWNAHSQRVYAYIYSLVANWADADDLFQETGLVVLAKFPEYQTGTHFGAWACRIAHNKVMQYFRERQVAHHLDEAVIESLQAESLELSAAIPARLSALSDCLSQMTAAERRLIQLRYFRSATVESIAQKTGQSTSTVYKSLAKIHEALLDCITRKLAQEDAV